METAGANRAPSHRGGANHADGSIARVLFGLKPFADESLPGFIARVTAWNFYETPKVILKEAGVAIGGDLSQCVAPRSRELAAVLRIPEPTLARMTFSGEAKRGAQVHYFGSSVRRVRIENRRRRVSPTSLRRSAHHRANWMISALPFCPESWEFLIDTCPSCRGELGWKMTCGIDLCEHCESDLKAAAAKEVSAPERSTLAVLAGLVSPLPEVRATAVAAVPANFHGIGPNAIFELILAVSRAAVPDEALAGGSRAHLHLSTADLCQGVQMVLEYPESFVRLSGSHRPDNTTTHPLFMRLRAGDFSFDPALSAFVTGLVGQHEPIQHGPTRMRTLREAQGHLCVTSAAQILSIQNADLRKLIDAGALRGADARGVSRRQNWILEEDVRTVGARLAQRLSANEFTTTYGLPLSGIEQLVSLGILRLNQDPCIAAIHPGLQLERSSALAFINLLEEALWAPRPNVAMPNLTDVFHGIGAQEKPWGPIIKAALNHRLPDGLAHQPGSPLKFTTLLVSDTLWRDLVLGRRPELTGIPDRAPALGSPLDLNAIEVERYLNCYPRDVSWLLSAGHLTDKGRGQRRIPRRQVEELGRLLISSREINWRWRVSPDLREGLATEYGIARTLGPFWPRAQVTEHFVKLFAQSDHNR